VSRPSTFCPPRAYYLYFNICGATGTTQSDSNRNETALIAHRGVNRILEYLATAFIHPAADFDQQVAVLRLAGSQHFQIRTADILDVIAKGRNRLVLDGYDDDQPVYRRVSNRTINRTVSKLAAPDHQLGRRRAVGRCARRNSGGRR
jgi:hypothetical protein